MTTDLQALAHSHASGILWSQASDDLNLNLMSLAPGGTIGEHINTEVDVLLVGVRGKGTISIDGGADALGPGRIVVIPKGARRAISAGAEGLAYLTCHRRRPGLQPGPIRRGEVVVRPPEESG